MASVVVNGDTSGAVTLSAPAVAGTVTVTLPSASGTMLTTASSTGISGSAISSGTVPEAYGGTGTSTGYYGFKNRIINGGCAVSQYGSVSIAANTNKTYGGCDRIALQTTGFSTISGTLVQAGSAGSGASATGFVQQFGSVTTTGSGTITFIQRIEAVNVGDLNSSAVTISLSLYQDTGSTLSPTINLYKPNALNDYTSSTFINGVAVSLPTGVRTTFTYTLTLGASDATNGLQVQINIPVGAITSKYFQIGNLQLEKGSTATSFDYRPVGTELALCQRYFYKTFPQATAPAQNTAVYSGAISYVAVLAGANYMSAPVFFPVVMRATPTTITFYNPSAANAKWRNGSLGSDSGNAVTNAGASQNGFVAVNNPQVAGDGVNNTIYIHATAEAEL